MEMVIKPKKTNKKDVGKFRELLTRRSDLWAIVVKEVRGDKVVYHLTTDKYFYEIPNYSLVLHVSDVFRRYKTVETIDKKIKEVVEQDVLKSLRGGVWQ